MLLKRCLRIFTRKFVPKIERKLSEKHVKNLQKTSLKLFPSTPKLQQSKKDIKKNIHISEVLFFLDFGPWTLELVILTSNSDSM